MYCTYGQALPSFFLNEHVFKKGSNAYPDLERDLSAASVSTGCLSSEHDNVERVYTTKTLAASFSPSAKGTLSLSEGPTGSVSPVSLTSFPPSGASTLGRASFQPEVSFSPVASPPRLLSVPASSASLATSRNDFRRAPSPSDSVKPSRSGAAQKGLFNGDTDLASRGLLQNLRDRLAQRDAEFAKSDDKYIQREELVTFL